MKYYEASSMNSGEADFVSAAFSEARFGAMTCFSFFRRAPQGCLERPCVIEMHELRRLTEAAVRAAARSSDSCT